MLRRTLLRTLVVALLAVLVWLPSGAASSRPKHPGGGGEPTPTPSCAAPAGSWTIGTHNVLHGSATFTPFAAVIGWQEADRTTTPTKLRTQLGSLYRHYIPAGSAGYIPVSWRADRFSFISARSVKTHEGRLGVSPDRWISIVHLRVRATGRHVVFVNTHFVSEAFKEGSSYRTWRLEMWYRHYHRLFYELGVIRSTWPTAPIHLVGDFNRSGYLNFDAHRVSPMRLGDRHPIDQLYAGVPGRGGCVAQLSQMGSDHSRWQGRAWIG